MNDCKTVSSKLQELSNRISSIEVSLAAPQDNVLLIQHSSKEQEVSVLTKLQELSDSVHGISLRLSQLENPLPFIPKKFPESYLNHVMNNLSMPGLKFIGGNVQNVFHNYLWLIIHVTAILTSYIFITEEYQHWQSSPVIRTLSNDLTSIEDIPFPGVTICIPNTLNSDFSYAESLKKCLSCKATRGNERCFFNEDCSSEEVATLAVASLMCDNTLNNGIIKEPPWLVFSRHVNKTIESLRFSNLLEKVFPACDVNITQIKHINDETNSGCDENEFEHFVVANSMYATCTTINGLRHEDIYKESTILPISIKPKQFDKKYKGKNFTLEKMFGFGASDTIPLYGDFDDLVSYHVTKRLNQTNLNLCNSQNPNKIAYVILHNPAEIPLMQDYFHGHVIHEDEISHLNIIPKLVSTEKGLSSSNSKERGCFYSHERQLSLFKHYNENNCEIECYVNCTLRKCGCVQSYFPTLNTSTKICLTKCQDYDCDCGCLPDCVSLSYKFEVNTVQANLSGWAHVQIGFKTKSFYSTIRVSINSFAQFVAFSLGILGVFNGFSVMVVLELFYLLTFSLWNSVKTHLPKNN